MKNTLTSTLLWTLLAISGIAVAQEQMMNPSMNGMQGMSNMNGMPNMAALANTGIGMVNRVDRQNGKINLTHGPIKSLGWPGMTMDFSVKDESLLDGLRPGEKVEFDVVKQGPGQFYIARIAPAQ
ncbi:MAG: hypothetical protein GC149_12530 [Gammaproteobacteria bacterium]|nr:hypothetical protein [Gammaproteobacteria bacterium]